jgi:hypothetical protein
MRRSSIRVAFALEVVLVTLQGVFPWTHTFLPLGGSELAQIGFAVSIAFVHDEVREYLPTRKTKKKVGLADE